MTDKSQTTSPGPWIWRWKSGSLHRAGNGYRFGDVVMEPSYEYDTGISVTISDADAALIAAAPDLAEALAAMVHTFRARPDILALCGFHEHAQIKSACHALKKAGVIEESDDANPKSPT